MSSPPPQPPRNPEATGRRGWGLPWLTRTLPTAPNRWDVLVLCLVLAGLVLLAWASRQMAQPYTQAMPPQISLSPWHLPGYAARTVLRMGVALVASLLFSLPYAALAAFNKQAEKLLLPLLDVLQSVPILGYLSISVTAFMVLFPHSLLGAELAAIFAIFTSQAWNITFSLYQSFSTVPRDLVEAARMFHLTRWQRFWRLDVPFAMPGAVWNLMMSVSGGWFFIVASEAISVSNRTIALPGIGSYIALAIAQRNLLAVGEAIVAMLVTILLYDQLLFRPLLAWAERFRYESEPEAERRTAWVLTMLRRSRLTRRAAVLGGRLADWSLTRGARADRGWEPDRRARRWSLHGWGGVLWNATLALAGVAAVALLERFVTTEVTWPEIGHAFLLGLATALRVLVMVGLASLVWVPIGVYVGLRPRLAQRVQPIVQFAAAFPANLLFPVVVLLIVYWSLNPEIWVSPLMILGTQWYIAFNVIAGTQAIPEDLLRVSRNLGLRGWTWWRRLILPAIFPSYVTGAVTAAGGSWNASIVAEAVSWGQTHLAVAGIGAYITHWTESGDFPRVALGIGVQSILVVFLNRILWRPLYVLSESKLRLD